MATVTASPKVGRNELCSCGSGKKSKRCCGAPEATQEDWASRLFNIAAVLAGVMLVVGLIVSARALFFADDSEPHRVWSAEHGHWHTVGGTDGTQQGGPGKVWNEEHGHYHDADAPDLGAKKPVGGALEGLRTSELDAAREKAAEGEAAR